MTTGQLAFPLRPVVDPIFDIAGGLLEVCAQHSVVIPSGPGINSPNDISTAAWTRTEVTASSASRCTVDVGATAPALFQLINNAGTVPGNPCTPMPICFDIDFGTVPFICVETRLATSVNRTWFSTAGVGTSGTSHATPTLVNVSGTRYRLAFSVVINGGAPQISIIPCSADGVLTAPAAGTFWDTFPNQTYPGYVGEAQRVHTIYDRMHDRHFYTLEGVENEMGYGYAPLFVGGSGSIGINSLPAIRMVAGRLLNTDAVEVLTHFQGTNPVYTLMILLQLVNPDLQGALFSIGKFGSANGFRSWGTDAAGTGRWAMRSTGDDGVVTDLVSTANIASATSKKVITIFTDATGAFTTWRDNGVNVTGMTAAAYSPHAITPNFMTLGCRANDTMVFKPSANVGKIMLWDQSLSLADIAAAEANTLAEWP